jgi:hypothetical protein
MKKAYHTKWQEKFNIQILENNFFNIFDLSQGACLSA